jgi:hypothetical protein
MFVDPALTYSELAAGLTMILSAIYLIYRIHHGSKSTFAYTLISFTFLDGAVALANFFISAFPHPVYANGQYFYGFNFYAN